ncbi:MAG: glycosyltransferase family 2 protein [Cytophagales bacterium]|nr:glycosyltransferase family 2 protein [Cytophagales bacterium]
MTKTAIAILNWNGRGFLEQFLPKVIEYSPGADIFVIDNASTDQSVQWLRESFTSVKVIQLDKNYGFCKGYNLGIEQIESKYLVLLNSDVEVTPGWLSSCEDLLDQNDHIAACQPKILDFYHRNRFEHAGAAGGYIDKYGNPFCKGRIFDFIEEDFGQYDSQTPIFWASGACMFIRNQVFKKQLGFREIYFAHMEEIDLCWRIQSDGMEIYSCPDSVVYHVGGGTLNKINPKKTYLNFRNCLLLVHYNFNGWRRLKTIFARLVLDGIAGVFFLVNGEWKHTLAIIHAHFSFYKILLGSKEVAVKNKKVPSLIYMRSVTFDYFLHKRKKISELDLKIPDGTSVPSQVFS